MFLVTRENADDDYAFCGAYEYRDELDKDLPKLLRKHDGVKIFCDVIQHTESKTLRDEFAMQAIAGYFPDSTPSQAQIDYRCKLAYQVADAMMKAR
jgi:hypothetical protein